VETEAGGALHNKRSQLALPPFGVRPLAVLRGGSSMMNRDLLAAFAPMTPALRWGAAETHNRYNARVIR
jgi:hypothetical protein